MFASRPRPSIYRLQASRIDLYDVQRTACIFIANGIAHGTQPVFDWHQLAEQAETSQQCPKEQGKTMAVPQPTEQRACSIRSDFADVRYAPKNERQTATLGAP